MHKLKANVNQGALIKAMEFGTINDDFLHRRITAKAYTKYPEEYWPIKIYLPEVTDVIPSKFTTFDDQRILGGEYEEHEITGDLKEAIQAFINLNGFL